ncbi:MAG: hypothetical protein ABIL45_04250 [candidate division WOR-3 bacterium]
MEDKNKESVNYRISRDVKDLFIKSVPYYLPGGASIIVSTLIEEFLKSEDIQNEFFALVEKDVLKQFKMRKSKTNFGVYMDLVLHYQLKEFIRKKKVKLTYAIELLLYMFAKNENIRKRILEIILANNPIDSTNDIQE